MKRIISIVLTLTLVLGMSGIIMAQTPGTDVSAGRGWGSYSIHGNNAEDKGEWEKSLQTAKPPQKWVTDSSLEAVKKSGIDAYYTYGECAKFKSSKADGYVLDVTSTGWSANYNPMTGKVVQSNPWGVTTTKVVPVDRGRFYTVAFKIKSTLQNEITICNDTTVVEVGGKKLHYTKGTGKYNYTKHFHIKAYDNTDPDGAALAVQSISATYAGKSVLAKTKDFNNLIGVDSRNTDYVNVTMTVLVPNDKADYQKKAKSPTMGIKMAYGAFLKEYADENNMKGEIEVKDFKVTAGNVAATAGKAKVKSVKAAKKKLTVKYKASGAKKYQVQVALKKNFKKGLKKKTTTKTKWTFKGLKKKKKYYVRVRGAKSYNGTYIWGKWSKVKKKKTK
ncbi:MAG: hypothetical protein J6W35_02840 [Eubacterium sp.]|nr:hypothetical protein [Eubacterium sp.]